MSTSKYPQSIAIVGSGLMGRVLAFELLKERYKVTLFDRDGELGSQSCGWTGAGMLAPYSELDAADDLVFRLGVGSTLLWPSLIESLPQKVFLQMNGSLIIAHSQDQPDLFRFKQHLENRLAKRETTSALDILDAQGIEMLEPEMGRRFSKGLYLAQEGQVDNRQLYAALGIALKEMGASWQPNTEVLAMRPFEVVTGDRSIKFEQVIDCRGLGAKKDLPKLRGVRGEIIRVKAPDVELKQPIRLMHPRYPLYIAPRDGQRFVIGATVIESEDQAPMTVQSALELLSAAFSVHPGFANASVLEMGAACRPALPDNVPRIYAEEGLMRINGLYRHGFLLAPKLAQLAKIVMKGDNINHEFRDLLIKERDKVASSH